MRAAEIFFKIRNTDGAVKQNCRTLYRGSRGEGAESRAENRNPVPAGLLGAVERFVGLVDGFVHAGFLADPGNADAHRNATAVGGFSALQGFHKPGKNRSGLIGADIQNANELVATPAGGEALVTDGGAKLVGDHRENGVSEQVIVKIVDFLEAVDVQHEKGLP